MRLRKIPFVFCVVVLLQLFSFGVAHGFVVITETVLEQNNFKLSMFSQEGFSVDKADVEYVMFNDSGQQFTGKFLQMGAGNYVAAIPTNAPAGNYTFLLRDRTYANEVVEASAKIAWPNPAGFGLLLPAAKGKGGPSPLLVGLGLALPVLLALGMVAAVLILRRNKKPVVSNSTHEANP